MTQHSNPDYLEVVPIDITAVVRSLLFIGKVKTDPTTRAIVHEKSSLAPPVQSLAFSLGDEKGFPVGLVLMIFQQKICLPVAREVK